MPAAVLAAVPAPAQPEPVQPGTVPRTLSLPYPYRAVPVVPYPNRTVPLPYSGVLVQLSGCMRPSAAAAAMQLAVHAVLSGPVHAQLRPDLQLRMVPSSFLPYTYSSYSILPYQTLNLNVLFVALPYPTPITN